MNSDTYDFDNNYNAWINTSAGTSGVGAGANVIGLGFSDKLRVWEGQVKNSGNTIWIMAGSLWFRHSNIGRIIWF